MKKIITLVIFIQCSLNVLNTQWVTHHFAVPMPIMPKPQSGIMFADPKFHTQVTRITDARVSGLPGIIPSYSKRQAWNSDESLLILQTGSGVFRLYDGTTYQFIRELPSVEGEDVFWHPSNNSVIIYNPANTLYSFNINTNQSTLIRAFSNFLWANTRSEGNLSADGRYYAFVGRYTDTTFNQVAVYDIYSNTIVSSLNLPPGLTDLDWVSISPSGNYVVIDYADEIIGRYHGVEVYDRSLNFLWQKPLGAGHSDLGTDVNGDDILVMDIYDSDSNKVFIKKFRLANGAGTVLLSFSQMFYDHISCRNEARHEWCFISTFDNPGRLVHDSTNWLPFEDEVFALKLDGSRQVQRIAHHHSRRFSPITPDPDRSVYWAEPHATVSRSGKRILWGSNWEQRVQSDTSVDTYVCDFTNMIGINLFNNHIPEVFSLQQNYPNPFNPSTFIRFAISSNVNSPFSGGEREISNARLIVYDILGRQISILVNELLAPGNYEVEFDSEKSSVAGLSSGLYYYRLEVNTPRSDKPEHLSEEGNFVQTRKMVLIK